MKTSPKLLWASVLAIVFLIAHLIFLPATLEDIDSLNFALGIHDFNPAAHQPHPPGYPLFMALAKTARVVAPWDAGALALLGALFGALAVFPLMRIFEDLEKLDGAESSAAVFTAALASVLTLASPLYWFNAGRPMSDVPGLAATLAAQAALASAFVHQRLNPARSPQAIGASGQMIVLGAFLSALAIGMRSQAMWLTLPMLALVLVQRAGRGAAGALLGVAMAFTLGVLLWAIPLVVASGGPSAYLAALSFQGGADFAGVDMLYRNPSARRLALGLLHTFIQPWASPALAWTLFGLAAIGTVALLKRAPLAVVLIATMVAPYLIVHLLVQETITTRYALPLIPAIAYLAVKGIEIIGGRNTPRRAFASVVAGLLVVWSLAITLPAVRVYAREGSPAFAAIGHMRDRLRSDPNAVVAMHQGLARSVETQDLGGTRVLKSPPMREWLELAAYWRDGHTGPVWFLADPARTDIELVDPLSRKLQAHYVWNFPRDRFIGGVRPDIVDLIRIDSPPGWYAEEGWHLTSETLNVSEQLGRTEGVAYIRSRPEAALLIVGAEHVTQRITFEGLTVTVTLDGRRIGEWQVRPGAQFLVRTVLEPGALANGKPFNRLVASYAGNDGKPLPIRLTQFAVAPLGAVFAIQHAGWNEIEYNRDMQRRWRWTTGSAQTFVNSGGRDVTLTIEGESPLRYFDAPPRVVVRAGSQVLATAHPSGDFEIDVKIPASALEAADGTITIETDKTFVPYERTGAADRRTLGLRIFRFEVR